MPSPSPTAGGAVAAPCDKSGREGNCQPSGADSAPKAGANAAAKAGADSTSKAGADSASKAVASATQAKQTAAAPAPKQADLATLQFSAGSFNVPEGGGSVTVTVTRTGPTTSAVSVDYRVTDKAATQKNDFTYAAGKLTFAEGETSKTFSVLITDDSFVEGTESAEIILSNISGEAVLGTPGTASLVILDDLLEAAKNPNSETGPFVEQHYHDFLSRVPDPSGLDFWTKEIKSCGDNSACEEVKRVNVSAAFYLSIEFQQTGYLIYRMYKAAFGNLPGAPVPVNAKDFLRDTQSIAQGVIVGDADWEQRLASNRAAFTNSFVRRPDFLSHYPSVTSATGFVNSLDANAGGVLTPDKKSALIRELSPNPSDPDLRASVLGKVAADQVFAQQEFNRAFVLMEYFGYLRRDPNEAPDADFTGYSFWLSKLEHFGGNYIAAEMVKAFINSDEYRARFGPLERANQRPAVDAGSAQKIKIPEAAKLEARVSDDTLPDNRTLTLSWSKVSGPGDVTFGDAAAASTTASFSLPGTYVLRLTANDSALAGSGDVTVEATKTGPPTIKAIVTPAPNAAGWNNSDVTVTFQCSDENSGIETCPDPSVITAETDGQTAAGTAVNKDGESATASVIVKIDKTPPVINVATPADNANVFHTPVSVGGTASDALSGLASVTCNGASATLTGSDFNCGVPLEVGTNPVTATAVDAAGNVSRSGRSLVYTRVPAVTINSPANLSYLNISPTTVTGTVDDPNATVTVNAVQAAVVNGTFSVALPLAEGPNVVTATATSKQGATGTATTNVTLDTTPPHVTITSPPDGFVTTAETVSVAGSINDIVVGTVNEQQAQVTVNGEPSAVANRTFLAKDVPLAVGPNVIQAVGRDRVGNSVTTQITVTRQAATQAHITLVSGNNQTGAVGSVLPTPLAVALTDEKGDPVAGKPVIFKVTQNDGLVGGSDAPAPTAIVTTDAQGRAQAQWKLGLRAGAGGNTVEAYSVGFEGTAIFTASGMQGAAGKIIVDTGNDQIGLINQPLPKPLIAVVVDEGNNRLGGVPVTFTVKEGGGSFEGQTTFTVNTDPDGRAAATLTLGLQEGNANNLVEVNFPSNTGFPASFTASGRAPGEPSKTTINGVVLDNSNVPIPGVTVRAVLTNMLNANSMIVQSLDGVQTNEQGQFTITNAPVGFVKLLVDGSTAQLPGKYPTLDYDMVTVAGQSNTVGGPVFLLPLNEDNKLCVTATTGGGTLTIPEAPGFSLTFGPGQVTFPGGTKEGCVSVTVVHGDKVPMVPGFGQQPRFIVTIQPAGAVFSPPARITLPNVDGLRPREVTEMYSFDHDIGSFVAIGTGTVSDDGRVIASNPGVGVLKAGWHCGGNPNTIGSAGTCAACNKCQGSSCVADNSQKFDDGKFCTSCNGVEPGPDCCRNGKGQATPVANQDIAGATLQDWDFSKLSDVLKGAAKAFSLAPGCDFKPPTFSGGIRIGAAKVCCEETKDFDKGFKYSGTLRVAGAGGQCLIPGLSLNLADVVEAGVSVGLSLGGEFTGAGVESKCANCGWSVSGSVALTLKGSIIVVTAINPNFLRFEGGVRGAGSLSGSCGCNGCGNFQGCLGPATVFGDVILGNFFKKGVDVEIPHTRVCHVF